MKSFFSFVKRGIDTSSLILVLALQGSPVKWDTAPLGRWPPQSLPHHEAPRCLWGSYHCSCSWASCCCRALLLPPSSCCSLRLRSSAPCLALSECRNLGQRNQSIAKPDAIHRRNICTAGYLSHFRLCPCLQRCPGAMAAFPKSRERHGRNSAAQRSLSRAVLICSRC